ncbi:MAG: hypothetical protein ACI32N_00370 [Bulleidia sp.]
MMKFRLFPKKKNCYLMHRDTPVLLFVYDENLSAITAISETIHPEHLPYGVSKGGIAHIPSLHHWLASRTIPENRSDYQGLMTRIGVENTVDLYRRNHGVSLSDTYWIQEKSELLRWKDVSPYRCDADYTGFLKAAFTKQNQTKQAGCTANNMTVGITPKAWVRENDAFLLYKGHSDPMLMDPVHHVTAGKIGQLLQCNALPCTLRMYEQDPVSVSRCFTSDTTDFVPFSRILSSYSTKAYRPVYDVLLDALKEHQIKDAAKKISDLFVLDYLMLKKDRSLSDIGVIVDAHTNRWLDIAPVFDFDSALACDEQVLRDDMIDRSRCIIFKAANMDFESMFPYIRFEDYDFSVLKELPREYGNMLVKVQKYSGCPNSRIEQQYILLYKRVLSMMRAAGKLRKE